MGIYDFCLSLIFQNVDYRTRLFFIVQPSPAGDAGDGILGIKGMGMVTASKTLANTPDTKEALWSKVQETYTKKGYTIADAILNARLTRILREGDYDYNTGEVKLWNP